MEKNWNLESINIALEYAKLCSEQIERNKKRIERQEKKLENLKRDNTLYYEGDEELTNSKSKTSLSDSNLNKINPIIKMYFPYFQAFSQ